MPNQNQSAVFLIRECNRILQNMIWNVDAIGICVSMALNYLNVNLALIENANRSFKLAIDVKLCKTQ